MFSSPFHGKECSSNGNLLQSILICLIVTSHWYLRNFNEQLSGEINDFDPKFGAFYYKLITETLWQLNGELLHKTVE